MSAKRRGYMKRKKSSTVAGLLLFLASVLGSGNRATGAEDFRQLDAASLASLHRAIMDLNETLALKYPCGKESLAVGAALGDHDFRPLMPKVKKFAPSRKKSLFSGKKRLNLVKLICFSSTSVCAKSVFIVIAALREGVI